MTRLESEMATNPTQTLTPSSQRVPSERRARWRGGQGPLPTTMSKAALNALRRNSPITQPMMSRAGIRAEARRVRSVMRAHMTEHQLIGGK